MANQDLIVIGTSLGGMEALKALVNQETGTKRRRNRCQRLRLPMVYPGA